jgi:hypothetical protein
VSDNTAFDTPTLATHAMKSQKPVIVIVAAERMWALSAGQT